MDKFPIFGYCPVKHWVVAVYNKNFKTLNFHLRVVENPTKTETTRGVAGRLYLAFVYLADTTCRANFATSSALRRTVASYFPVVRIEPESSTLRLSISPMP